MAEPPTGNGELTAGSETGRALLQVGSFSQEITYSVRDGLAYLEADIVLGSAEQIAQTGQIEIPGAGIVVPATPPASWAGGVAYVTQGAGIVAPGEDEQGVAIADSRYRWDDATIPYEISPDLPRPERVTGAIEHWTASTRMRFIERTPAEAAAFTDYVLFAPGEGCSSRVGRVGEGMQRVTLGEDCSMGSCVHEIGHTVGLWHEHSRSDRDTYVTIDYLNIEDGRGFNFDKHVDDGIDLGSYDYASITHYPRTAFSKNGQPTIVPAQVGAQVGQRDALSEGDVRAVAMLYPS